MSNSNNIELISESQRSDSMSVSVLTSSQSQSNNSNNNICPYQKEKKVVTDCYFTFGPEQQSDKGNFKNGTCAYCGATVKWNPSKGVGNLYNHVVNIHKSDYVDRVKEYVRLKKVASSNNDNGEFIRNLVQANLNSARLVSDKAKTIASWLQWITEGNLPFVFVEKELTRKFSKLDSVSIYTIKKYLEGVSNEIVSDLHEEIKKVSGKIGILTDGWDDGSGTHYFCLYGCYQILDEKSNELITKTPLLAISPPFDEEDYTAESVADWIRQQCLFYGINNTTEETDLLFMVADNAPVMKAASNLLGCYFIGCSSHKLNLAIKEFLAEACNNDILEVVDDVMKRLRTLKCRGRLRKLTKIGPIARMDRNIRWSSNYYMMKRYFELKPHFAAFNTDNDDPIVFLRKGLEQKALTLFGHLEQLQSITIALQSQDMDLKKCRLLLENVINDFQNVHPSFEKYLAIDATINKENEFQSALLKIVNKKEHELDDYEKVTVEKFKKVIDRSNDDTVANSIEDIENNKSLSYSEKIIKKDELKRRMNQESDDFISKYVDVSYIPVTSNVCERLFSRANLVFSDLRKSMEPSTLEQILILTINKSYWSAIHVQRFMNKANE